MDFRHRKRSPLRLPLALLALAVVAASAVLLLQRGFRVSPGLSGGPNTTSGGRATATPLPATWEEKARNTAEQYLTGWAHRDYRAMYDVLSDAAKQSIAVDRFVTRYQAISTGAAITSVVGYVGQATLFPGASNPMSATVDFRVSFQSGRVGSFEESNTIPLARSGDDWSVVWTPDLIFRDLGKDNLVRMDGDDPARGAIVDRSGRMLAGPGSIVSVGLVPGEIEDEAAALKSLSDYLGMPQASIKAKYANAQADWWVPLADLPEARRAEATTKLAGIAGLEVRKQDARVYPLGSLAAHVVGYVAPISADDLVSLAPQGYEENDFVGRSGIEAWAERQLAGQKGGRLLIADPDGDTVRVIAQRRAKAGATVKLTIDVDIQQLAEKALGDKTGSVVVIDSRDNSVLAMASHPAFDPNAFITGFSNQDWQKLSSDPGHPFQNRAALSAYATGSIFKVITMVAGLEKGGFRPDTPFECAGTWTGLPGVVMRDWLPQGHGRLDLQEGLTESCNIVFYEIGKKLDSLDASLLPSVARQFGLGELTGIIGLDEAKGTVPDPSWKQQTQKQSWFPGDSVNLAIGQGFLEATPLQMANLYAALANGGELRTPVVVRQVRDGSDAKTFATNVRRRLPATAATLSVIREAMKNVTASPKGTAYYAFQGFKEPTAAKTGSAENQDPNAHAWFAAYAPADAAEVTVLVMVEGGKAGSEVAAPIGRQIMDGYFKGR